MGTNTHFWQGWDPDKIMPMIEESGFGWIRDEIYWGNIEMTKGNYIIQPKVLKWIKEAHKHNLKLILILNGGNRLYTDIYDAEAYAKFASNMAKQLKGLVDAFEILNEPANFGYMAFYGGNWNGLEKDGSISLWVSKYVNLCNKATQAIKEENPSVKVIGLGSVAPVNFRQLAMGISPFLDGIVDHPYSFKTVPEIVPYASSKGILQRDGIATADTLGTFSSMINMYRQQSKKYNGPKEIWLTEFGYTNYQPDKPEMYAGFTLDAQAKYLQRRFMECLGLGVDVTIQYDFKDDGKNIHNAEYNFGLIDSELKKKPAYTALQLLAKATAGLNPSGDVSVKVFPYADRPDQYPIIWDGSILAAPGTIPTYAFHNQSGKTVIAIWSAERSNGDLNPRLADIEIKYGKKVTKIKITDLMSGKESLCQFKNTKDGLLIDKFNIPDHPILLTLEQ